jgi:glyoxylase-like metal-dependent hydrolase (beta-lactamase superfamily II)
VIEQIFRVAKGCITHVVISAGEAVVIDAVRHLDRIRTVLDQYDAKLRHVFDTHLQADHISGGRELAAATGARYHLNPADAAGATFNFAPLSDGAGLDFGQCRLRVLHTPGHTPGSTSLILNDRFLFSGDTVMATTVGRPDLGGKVDEWAEMLYDTIHGRLQPLDDEIVVLPSHAASVGEMDATGVVRLTLGQARRVLPHFALTDRADFVAHVKAALLENPERYQDIRRVNLGQLKPEEKQLQVLEIGKNLCGMAGNK